MSETARERLPGITDEELIRRVMMNMTKHRKASVRARWVTVACIFALGSTYSQRLCRDFGYDPDEQLKG